MFLNTVFRQKSKFSLIVFINLMLVAASLSLGAFGTADEGNRQEEKLAFIAAGFKSVISGAYFSPALTFVVNSSADSVDAVPGNGVCADLSGSCTLRAAIQEANASPGTDAITFALTTTPATIQLNSTVSPTGLAITEAVNINGPGARFLSVSGNSATGEGIFNVSSSVAAWANISGITIVKSGGHGINNDGWLNLTDVAVKTNKIGINNSNRLNINRVAVSGNTDSGISLAAASNVNISNTTITNNDAPTFGGGIRSFSAKVTLNNVTISHNTAETGGGIYYSNTSAGFNLRNTIVALNTAAAGPDVFAVNNAGNGKFVSLGTNIIGRTAPNMGFPDALNTDKTGTLTAPLNPMLGDLQNNGGSTDTRSLAAGSPAIDAGNMCIISSSCGLIGNPNPAITSDQRGTDFPRVYDGNNNGEPIVDIGAFESFYPVASISSFAPNNWGAGRGAFELVINGTNFVAGSKVKWKGQDRVTTFVSNTQLKAQILANDTVAEGQNAVTVVNPSPGGGASEAVNFSVVSCAYSINPAAQAFTRAGGSSSFAVTAVNGCAWTAVTDAPWLTFTNGSDRGTGTGTVSYSVDPNRGPERSAIISVGGKTYTVSQEGGCTYSISPTASNTIAATGGGGSFTVIPSSSACGWTATASAPWITVTNQSGTSSGTINYTVAPNTGSQRDGNITVNGEVFFINQASGCSFALSQLSAEFSAAANNGNFDVIVGSGCTWTAVSSASWVHINSGASGSGNGAVLYTVDANTGPERTATISVGGKTFNITQAGGCTYTLSATSANDVAAAGANLTVNVTASNTGCSWTSAVTAANASWITVTSPTTVTGSGTVQITVAANTGLARRGTLTIANQTFTVNQASGCVFTVSPTGASGISASGETKSFNLTTPNSGCTWTATPSQAWITVNPPTGTGSGTINYTVAPNTGPGRSGSITVGGATFNISQDSGCAFTLNSTTASVGAAAGSGTLNVSSGTGCTWTAVSSASWLKITTGTPGSGSGAVLYTYEANNGPERTATITVNGQVFTLTQASGCTYTLSATSANDVAAAGANLTVNVTASNTGCSWTSAVTAANASWITVTSPTTVTGSGTVQITVAANTGLARRGTLTIANQTFTVNQNDGCTYTLSSSSADFGAEGGAGSFNVVTNNQGCTWTATKTDSWITIISGSPGTGDGTVSFAVQQNFNPARTGKIIVNGKEFLITQSNGCSYTLPVAEASALATGGTGNFTLNTAGNCPWTAVSNSSWITITSSANSTGTGTVNYSIASNNGPVRTGTITAGGKTFTITQGNGCTFTITPTNANNISAAGQTVAVAVTASNAECSWTSTVAADSPWITISGNSGANGNGTVQLTIAANVGPARTGTATIAGRTFTVNQVSGCTYTLSPATLNINENGGDRSFNIISGTGCPWTVQSNDTWLTILSETTGTGVGTITFRVAANSTGERTGTITAGGQTFTVHQLNLIVANLNDDGPGSLRKAVANANAAPGDDIVTFMPTLNGTIYLTSGEIVINSGNGALEIKGLGADVLKISGSNMSRIFYSNNSSVTITDLTLTEGNGVGLESSNTNRSGGAIFVNGGSFSLNRVHIFRNVITVPNSPLSRSVGGGIYFQDGTDYRIQNSTIFLNSAAAGGGLFNQGELTVVNSTIIANTGTSDGGGIYTVGLLNMRNSTVTGNRSNGTDKGAGIIMWGGTMRIGNTIIAGNIGPEISFINGSVASEGNNLIGDEAGDSSATTGRVNYQPTDILDTRPMLSVLENYGGGTFTAALLPGSPAINAGNNANAPATDQRGAPRIINQTIDIGAFEHNITVTPQVTALADGSVNASYSQRIGAERIGQAGSTEAFAFEVIDGYLPSGTELTRGNGILQGTIQTGGNHTFTVRATGVDGLAGVSKYTIAVGCSYTINAADMSISAAGGNGTISLTTSPGCEWTAVSNFPWITVNGSAASGTGNGQIALTIAANTGAARTGTVTVAGKTFTVNQSTGCTYSLSAASADVPFTGGTTGFNINTGANCPWTITSNAAWLTAAANGTGAAAVTANVGANTGAARTGTLTVSGNTFTVNQAAAPPPPIGAVKYDYDGDGKSDVSVYRPSTGIWHLFSSQSGYSGVKFGDPNDKLVPADYDGDKRTDLAVFREDAANPNTAYFYIMNSSDNTVRAVQLGSNGDSPLAVGDWDGDGKADAAVYRPGTDANPQGYFYYRPSSQPGVLFNTFPWGSPGDKPVVADFDGDGKVDPAVFRPSSGVWFVQRSRDGFYAIQFGATEDKPIVGDYDGDGRADQAVFRPSNGVWYLWQSTAGFAAAQFGISTDSPVPGDYDGDRRTDVAVYRDGTWFILNSTRGFDVIGFGISTDKPAPNSFVP